MNNTKEFYSCGKLLLSSEYLVLQGAKALALPINRGQKTTITASDSQLIEWETYELGTLVFTAKFSLPKLKVLTTTDTKKAVYISSLLLASKALNPDFISGKTGFFIKSNIEFNMSWGLGSSSTLINNIAQWAKVNPFKLNRIISKGSGYDVACASQVQPIVFELDHPEPLVKKVLFNPPFLNQLNLLYLNKKMATEKNITDFMAKYQANENNINITNWLTNKMIHCQSLKVFKKILRVHEMLVSRLLSETPVKQRLFNDFEGEIKSLGAWGGDFTLVASNLPYSKQEEYFSSKGFSTFFPLTQLLNTSNE